MSAHAIPFPSVKGEAGEVKEFKVIADATIEVREVFANDTAMPPGVGTRIVKMRIGKASKQFGNLSAFFWRGANPKLVERCQKGEEIAVTVSFLSACEFTMDILGETDI